ncbi:hypothetical protein D3C87_442190 [compost metagenome]
MKKIATFLLSIFSLTAAAQYLGVNTTSPKANLHLVGAPATTTIADGVLTPRLTRAQLIAKTAYGADQIGTVIYVSDLSGTTNAATTNVTVAGHYYFDGTTWNAWLPAVPQLYGFRASKTTTNSANANTPTILSPWDVEEVDTHNWFDETNGRFAPKIAGYYKINFNVGMLFGSTARLKYAAIHKNGNSAVNVFYGSVFHEHINSSTGSGIVYMNGTTDYLNVRHYVAGSSQQGISSVARTNFQAFFIGE